MNQKKKKKNDKNDYKVVISELKDNPLQKIKICFALMAIIPLLVFLYLLLGKNYLFNLFLGTNGLIMGIAIFISILGFFVAYNLVRNMVDKLFSYFKERKLADQEKLELISGFSHDVKTPLTVAKTGLQNMIDGIGGILNNTQSRVATVCIKALDRASNFINQMLQLAKTKVVIASLKRELIDFDQLIKNEVKEINTLAQKNNQKVTCRVLATDPKVWGDEEKLSRAVMNLLSNAVKYADAKGRIDVVLSSDQDTIKLAIINTGPGIPEDKLNQIFVKYERIKNDSKIEGTGLGLALVKDIIDLHKGHITVKSIPNKETEFNIILPRDLRALAKIT
ncbi:MAG: HAMP domain-containing sensor histidine kinase [Candidatus Omnitrophota bacterium]